MCYVFIELIPYIVGLCWRRSIYMASWSSARSFSLYATWLLETSCKRSWSWEVCPQRYVTMSRCCIVTVCVLSELEVDWQWFAKTSFPNDLFYTHCTLLWIRIVLSSCTCRSFQRFFALHMEHTVSCHLNIEGRTTEACISNPHRLLVSLNNLLGHSGRDGGR